MFKNNSIATQVLKVIIFLVMLFAVIGLYNSIVGYFLGETYSGYYDVEPKILFVADIVKYLGRILISLLLFWFVHKEKDKLFKRGDIPSLILKVIVFLVIYWNFDSLFQYIIKYAFNIGYRFSEKPFFALLNNVFDAFFGIIIPGATLIIIDRDDYKFFRDKTIVNQLFNGILILIIMGTTIQLFSLFTNYALYLESNLNNILTAFSTIFITGLFFIFI